MKTKTRDMVFTALFTALMTAGAFIRIPFPYVPLTFQPFFCAFSGIILGSRLGTISQLMYVSIGLLGIPVFAYGGGFAYIYNPTFGYLIGFIAASFVIGKICEGLKLINLKNCLTAVIPGLIIINVVGVPYFYLISKLYLQHNITVWYLISTVFLPYFLKDLLLYIIAAMTAVKIIPIFRKYGYVHK